MRIQVQQDTMDFHSQHLGGPDVLYSMLFFKRMCGEFPMQN